MNDLKWTSILLAFIFVAISFTACEKYPVPEPDPREAVSGILTENTTWNASEIYVLDGKVVVSDGVTLTIEPGTIVKGLEGVGSLSSALVVARGGKLIAEGTADKPIIFTSILDNIDVGQKSGTNLDQNDRSKWGGLIICGKAPSSAQDGDDIGNVEGIPANEEYGKYGGNDASDNSGVLRYVSIRHGGAEIGEGNEINGLTLGGVGNGTTIENIEVVSNLDDGIEFFGGTVNVTNALVAFQGDDAFDIDQNYSGTITNLISIQDGQGDNALEIDGPEGATHADGLFTIINGTFICTDNAGGRAATLKAKAQGTIKNCTFEGFKKPIRIRASFVDTDNCVAKTDAYLNMMVNNTLVLEGNTYESNENLAELIGSYSDDGIYDDCIVNAMETDLDNKFALDNTVVVELNMPDNSSAFKDWTWSDINNQLQ